MFKFYKKKLHLFAVYCIVFKMKQFWTIESPRRQVMSRSAMRWPAASILCGVLLLAACDSIEGAGNAVSNWTSSIGDRIVGLNPLGAEAISIGRSLPVIAGNTFVSGGNQGIRINFSYDFRLAGKGSGNIGGKPTTSWLFVDRRLENAETYLQLHKVVGGNLENFGKGESFFVDRAGVTAQNYCIGENSKEIPQIVLDYIEFVNDEGFPVPREYLLRRMTESADRDGVNHRVDVVYIEDVLRAGYTCEELGNLLLPSSEAIKTFLDAYKIRSTRSFAIVG